MLAMQSSNFPTNVASTSGSISGHAPSGVGPPRQEENAQEKLRRLMDLPATDDLEWARQDR